MTIDPSQVRDFAARYTAAWCSRNPASVAAFFSALGSLTINGAAPAQGRPAITESVRGFMTAFPDLQIAMDDLMIDGERIEYHWTLTGTNNGPGGTGHRVRVSGFEQWQFSPDGLIAVSRGRFDSDSYDHQLAHGFDDSQS